MSVVNLYLKQIQKLIPQLYSWITTLHLQTAYKRSSNAMLEAKTARVKNNVERTLLAELEFLKEKMLSFI